MRTKSHWKHLLIGLFFVILVFMVTVGIASCKKNTDEDSSSVDEPITGDEAGIYYFDADDAEYLISLKGNNFTLSISDETLYGEYTNGMISAVGVRNVVENKVDFTNTRNVIIAALILVLAIGITYSGSIQIGVVSLSGLAVSSIVGILLNAILPGKDYTFEQDDQGATSVDFKV